jgi:hypothetical protein
MYSVKVVTQGAARDISDKTIAALTAQMGQARGLQAGDFVGIVNSASRVLSLAIGRAATADSVVSVDFMAARTKEGRRFTWTCQIDVDPAAMNGDRAEEPVPASLSDPWPRPAQGT